MVLMFLFGSSARHPLVTEFWSHCCVLQVSDGYLQVSLHERRPGLHQVVADSPLTGRGGFMERRLASERETKKKHQRELKAHLYGGKHLRLDQI